jgi:mono/diheme cytochrome c family protein
MRLVLVILLSTLMLGCEQRMANQRRYEPQEIVDTQSLPPGRRDIPGTLAKGSKLENIPPQRYSRKDLEAGQSHFEVYCAPCHGLSGKGDGMVVKRGFPAPPSFHDDSHRQLSIDEIFQVISHGSGIMYAYANRLLPIQRWQTAAYVKVLQRSQYVPKDELTPAQRKLLENQQ